MLRATIAFGMAVAGIAAAPPPALVAALLRDREFAACVTDAGTRATAYAAHALAFRDLTLRDGTRLTVAIGADGCMFRGQSARIMIFRHAARGAYRLVYDGVTLPEHADVRADGTMMLPTHESPATIFEAAYVWNGETFVFSGPRSHVYDVPLAERRPYQIDVRFAPGASSTVLAGRVSADLDDHYVFHARAGQLLTLALIRHTGLVPFGSLWTGGRAFAEIGGGRWRGRLPRTGTYDLTMLATGSPDPDTFATYVLRIAIE